MKFGKNDAILITKLENIFYLTGFTGSNAQILFVKNGEKYFFTDSRYDEQSRQQVKKGFNIVIYQKFEDTLKKIVKKEKIKNLGFEAKHLTYYQYIFLSGELNISLNPLENTIENLRIKKKKREVARIRKAIEISEKSLKNIAYKIFEKNIREVDFKLLLETEMMKNGGDEPSFPTIVASGKRSSLIHGIASKSKLNTNNTVIVDFGVKYRGYCSDKTVTFLNKNSCKEIKNAYNIVKSAKNYAIEKIKAGIKAKDIDRIAREYIEKKRLGKFFTHSLGHGIGVEVHESPTLSPLSNDILKKGMVFTIEPGVYIPEEFGIRLEDVVYIGDNGVEVLTELAENFLFEEF